MMIWLHSLQSWPSRRWLALTALLLLILYGTAIGRQQAGIINGRLAFWLHDDMMISMRYAHHLAQQQGLVWNPGSDPVEGYSNFGWVLIMTLVHLLPLPLTLTSLIILSLNLLIALWILLLTARLIHTLVPQATLALPATLLTLTLSTDLFRWTIIGLETPLQTAVFLWLTLRLLSETNDNTLQPRTFFLMGTLGLIRADGLALIALLCLLAGGLHPAQRRLILLSSLALLLPLAHLLFRLAYYQELLPNTYYLKLTGWNGRWLPGLLYLGHFLQHYGWAWLLSGWLLWQNKSPHRQRPLALWLLGLPLLLYTLYTGGDDFDGLRFLAPWLPVLLCLLYLSPHWFTWRGRPLATQPLPHALLLTAFTLVLVGTNSYTAFWNGPSDEALFLAAGLALGEQTPPDTTIGVFWAGTLPYFAQRPSVDMLGKNDATIAHQPTHPTSLKPGHNKFDYTYSLTQQQPDLLVAPVHPGVIAQPNTLARYQTGPDAYVGQLYQHPVFQELYAPHLLFIGEVPIFIRQDSPLQESLMNGRCQPVTHPTLTALGLKTACSPNQPP